MTDAARETRLARRGLAIYFTVLVAGSAYLEATILRAGGSISTMPWLVVGLMYVPAAASLVARLALREGFEDVSFRFSGREGVRASLLGWIYPMIVGFAAYGAAWALGLAAFERPFPPSSRLFVEPAGANLILSLLFMATFGSLAGCVTAFGEELGWRGYMLTRLMTAGVPKPVLVSGLIWAGWHIPLILSGQYAAGAFPRVSAALFVIGTVAMGYLEAYVRLQSGSLWPAVLLHGAWNAIIQGTFDRATVGTPLAVGESGWITVAVSAALVLILTRGRWNMQREPGVPLMLGFEEPALSRP